MNSYQIARSGEIIVNDILKGSDWVNKGIYDLGKDYDIVWKNIKIDVKTTTRLSAQVKNTFLFYDNSPDTNTDVIFVFIAIYKGKNYFYIEKGNTGKRNFLRKIKDAISREDLPKYLIDFVENLKHI